MSRNNTPRRELFYFHDADIGAVLKGDPSSKRKRGIAIAGWRTQMERTNFQELESPIGIRPSGRVVKKFKVDAGRVWGELAISPM